jgi:outer membrane protein assembly factor BamB
MRNRKFFIALCCLLTTVSAVNSQSLVQWRGANRDGIYQEKGLLKTWPAEGPQLLWQTEVLGNGYGSPSVTGDRLYVNGETDGVSYVFAFDLKGNLVWKSANGPEFMGQDYSASFPGSRSQPTVVDGMIYACSGMGRVACFEAATGKEKWGVDMLADLKGKGSYFGYSESVLVVDKLVYCFPGGAESNIVALDKLTGKIVWTSKAMGDPVSYCSPIVVKFPQRNVLVNISHEYLMGLDAKTGELLWSYKEDSVKREGEYCNTPVYADGFIYGVSGVEKGKGAYKLALSADGKSVKESWTNPDLKNKMGGFVKLGDRIYCTSADHKLKCIDANSGKVTDALAGLFGTLIYADGQLFCYNDNGNVSLINISGPKMEVVSKFKVTKGSKEHFAHPVIANGVLYIRHGNALMAYSVK